MTPDRERWVETLAVERTHGDGAPLQMAKRFGALSAARDSVGVARWLAIARRLEGRGGFGSVGRG